MLNTRLIPVLLLSGRKVVKTLRFEDPKYIGDPVNILRIFNEKEVDEIVVLDIDASREDRSPDYAYLRELAGECFMPMAFGGGLRTIDAMDAAFRCGVEKVVVNSAAARDPAIIAEASRRFGSQSVVASIDFRTSHDGIRHVASVSGTVKTERDPVAVSIEMARAGAGEILLTSIDRDGTLAGYDLDATRAVAASVEIPVIACGGAGSLEDCARVVKESGASAAAAGSFFVFCGGRDAILVTYPDRDELSELGLIEDDFSGSRRDV
jgi:imidazole glycerol-phosphate synthase subunit HisF